MEWITCATNELSRSDFAAAFAGIGAHDDSAFDVVANAHAEAHRSYHNGEHINECLRLLTLHRSLAERPLEVVVAIYFHDLICDPLSKDNELASAACFRRLASKAGVSDRAVESVARLIEGTARHEADCADGALLNDLDLAILGSSEERYARYERGIALEYASVPLEAYRTARARVLRKFLDRPAIYQRAEFSARFEVGARKNLSRAIAALET